MDLLLGIDVGTTTVKALAVGAAGQPRAAAARSVHLQISGPGWVEQDPEELWEAVQEVCRKVASQLQPQDLICALSLSVQGGTTIPVDAHHFPTHAAFSWMDERAGAEAKQVQQDLGRDRIYRTTGWPLMDGMPLTHIAWFKKYQPEAFHRTARYLFVNDFITARLCGEFSMDPSNASITQLFNVQAGDWDETILEQVGIQKSQLSAVQPSGQIVGALTKAASQATGLKQGIPVVNGAHDQYCAALGAGITRPGEVLLSCGTAWVILAVLNAYEEGVMGGMCISRHALPDMWGGIRSMGGVGATSEWLLTQFWPDLQDTDARYRAFNQASAAAPAGAGGLIFMPLSGGHLESGYPANRGLLGLTLQHTRGDVARALMEGIACELNWMLDEIRPGIGVQRLKMIGGAAASTIWPQIVADVTRLPVDLLSVSEAASLGAALLAGLGAGWFSNLDSVIRTFALSRPTILPDPNLEIVSTALNRRYRELWNVLPHQDEG